MKTYDIITFGSAVVDAFVDVGLEQRNKYILLPAGQKMIMNNITFSTGGGGTNSACSLSKLGFKVAFLGKIGKGQNASFILDDLKKYGVDFIGAQSEDYHTGYSIILDSMNKDRTVLVYKGASNHLKLSDIVLENLKTKWFYFSSMIEKSFKTQVKLAGYAKKKGIKIIFNPSSYQVKLGAKYLKDLLNKVNILTLNKEEARMLVPKGDVLKGLRNLGPKIVCITDGENEGKVYDGKYKYTFIPNKVKCIERTGAGDAFASAFLSGIIRFNDIEKAIKMGCANAESLIQKRGAKNGLLNRMEMEKAIKNRAVKVKKEVY